MTREVEDATLAWVASASFAGMAVGAILGGVLADKFGRTRIVAFTLLLYGAASASALAWSVGILVLLRFIVALRVSW